MNRPTETTEQPGVATAELGSSGSADLLLTAGRRVTVTAPAEPAPPKICYRAFLLDNKELVFPDAEPDTNRLLITSLDIDPTEKCNLRCSYCFKGQLQGRVMSFETAKQTVKWLYKYSGAAKNLHIALLGGEPLLAFELMKAWVPWAYTYCEQRDKNLTFGVTTNGTIFNQEHHDFFRQWHIGIHLSIDGLPDVQDQERKYADGRGSSKKLEENLPRIFSAWPVVHARSTVVPATVDRLCDSYRYFCELGFKKVAFTLASGDEWGDPETIGILVDQLRQVLDYHWNWIKQHQQYYVLTMLSDYVRKLNKPDPDWGKAICGAGRGMMHVDAEGLLWPCHRFNGKSPHENLILGSVWGGFDNAKRDCFLAIRPLRDMVVSCSDCEARLFCSTPCVASNWQERGNIYDAGMGYCEAMRAASRVHRQFIEEKKVREPAQWEQYVDWVLNWVW